MVTCVKYDFSFINICMVTGHIFFSFMNSVNSFSINQQVLFLNQWKRKNELRNIFKTNSSQKNVADTGIVLGSI